MAKAARLWMSRTLKMKERVGLSLLQETVRLHLSTSFTRLWQGSMAETAVFTTPTSPSSQAHIWAQFQASLAVQYGPVTVFQPKSLCLFMPLTRPTYEVPSTQSCILSSAVRWIDVNTQLRASLENRGWRWPNFHQPGSHLMGLLPCLDLHE